MEASGSAGGASLRKSPPVCRMIRGMIGIVQPESANNASVAECLRHRLRSLCRERRFGKLISDSNVMCVATAATTKQTRWRAAHVPYDDDEALTQYVLENYRHLLTEAEALSTSAVAPSVEHNELRMRMTQGPPALDPIRDRILREHADEVFVNRCQRCGRIAPKPLTNKCATCGYKCFAAGGYAASGPFVPLVLSRVMAFFVFVFSLFVCLILFFAWFFSNMQG